jgi:hypothetical protein
MKSVNCLALIAGASLLLMASASQGATAIDGVITPGEYTNAIVTNTPYNPNSDTTLASFSNGNELVAETTYFQNDPNGQGFDFAVQTDPRQGQDNADASVGLQFTNVYFGNETTGAVVVFELGNHDAVNLVTNQKYVYDSSTLGIEYADVAGTSYANGGDPSTSETYIPYAAYNNVLTNLGINTVGAGNPIEVRDLQAFSYGGNNAGGGSRFGTLIVPAVSAVPEPGVWIMMLGGFATLGAMLRIGHAYRREQEVVDIATA